MTKLYDIYDTRDAIGKWSVVDMKKHRSNPINWRNAVVFRGSKAECKEFVKKNGKLVPQ